MGAIDDFPFIINQKSAPYIIADIGSNWCRTSEAAKNLDLALECIESAAKYGASAVKFQFFTHEELYGRKGDNTYSLPKKWLGALHDKAKSLEVDFMCTAFSSRGVYAVDPFVKIHKVASAEMMHTGILDAIIALKRPMIVSTGGATGREVAWLLTYLSDRSAAANIMQCVSSYPANPKDYNLNFLLWLRQHAVCSGLSDHTLTNNTALIAAGCGATVFEKHLDPFKNFLVPAPDTAVSVDATQFHKYCLDLREAFLILGPGKKAPAKAELFFLKNYRRAKGGNTFRPGSKV